MDRQDILRQLSNRTTYAADTVRYCLEHPHRTVSIFLPLLQKTVQNQPLETLELNALYFGLHLLGKMRFQKALPALVDLAVNRPDMLNRILGEQALGTTFPCLLMGLGEGQGEFMMRSAQTLHVDFMIRDAFLRTWTFEVFEGRISQAAAVRDLSHFLDNETTPPPDDLIWSGWLGAVADLGFRDLEPIARDAISTGRILAETGILSDIEFRDFETALQEAEKTTEPRSTVQRQCGYIPFGDAPGDWGKAFVNAPT